MNKSLSFEQDIAAQGEIDKADADLKDPSRQSVRLDGQVQYTFPGNVVAPSSFYKRPAMPAFAGKLKRMISSGRAAAGYRLGQSVRLSKLEAKARKLRAQIRRFSGLLANRSLFQSDQIRRAEESVPDAGYKVSLIDPRLERSASTRTSNNSEQINVSFIGPWNYGSGLGAASRGYVAAIWHARITANLHAIRAPFHVHHRISPTHDVKNFDGPADLCILHLNPNAWGLLTSDLDKIRLGARRRVGLWVWETEDVPDSWAHHFEEVDEIWVPSTYCQKAFKKKTSLPVKVLPHAVLCQSKIVPMGLKPNLVIPDHRKIILYVFDGSSYLVRKNPCALVRAFALSGLARLGWSLVLKTMHLHEREAEARELASILKYVPETYLIDRVLSRRESQGLFAACNIYASPHCSEGFGLTVAEAMALGKIVVSTDYGGTTDFVDDECGFPVRWRSTKLDKDYGPYARGSAWAAVDEDHLADSLVQAAIAVEDSSSTIGNAAEARIRSRLHPSTVGNQLRSLCQAVI